MTFPKSLPVVFGLALALVACAPAPSSKVPPPAPLPAGTAPTAELGILLTSPEGSEWVKPGITADRSQADVDDCYRYAQAQIDHDVRVENDSQAAFESFPTGLGWTELRNRQRNFEQGNRRSILFTNCMVGKGYAQR